MSLTTLLYISFSALDDATSDQEVDRIVATARDYNPTVDITGALLYTGLHFAQILEGSDDAVQHLLQSILRDVRHRDLLIVSRECIRGRTFHDWSMAYAGSSIFVAGHVARVLDAPSQHDRDVAVRALTALMAEFTRK